MTVTVQKWGNSLGVRIPRAVAQNARLDVGSAVEMVVRNGQVVLKPVEVPSLHELLAHVTPGSRPELEHWGRPQGKEVW